MQKPDSFNQYLKKDIGYSSTINEYFVTEGIKDFIDKAMSDNVKSWVLTIDFTSKRAIEAIANTIVDARFDAVTHGDDYFKNAFKTIVGDYAMALAAIAKNKKACPLFMFFETTSEGEIKLYFKDGGEKDPRKGPLNFIQLLGHETVDTIKHLKTLCTNDSITEETVYKNVIARAKEDPINKYDPNKCLNIFKKIGYVLAQIKDSKQLDKDAIKATWESFDNISNQIDDMWSDFFTGKLVNEISNKIMETVKKLSHKYSLGEEVTVYRIPLKIEDSMIEAAAKDAETGKTDAVYAGLTEEINGKIDEMLKQFKNQDTTITATEDNQDIEKTDNLNVDAWKDTFKKESDDSFINFLNTEKMINEAGGINGYFDDDYLGMVPVKSYGFNLYFNTRDSAITAGTIINGDDEDQVHPKASKKFSKRVANWPKKIPDTAYFRNLTFTRTKINKFISEKFGDKFPGIDEQLNIREYSVKISELDFSKILGDIDRDEDKLKQSIKSYIENIYEKAKNEFGERFINITSNKDTIIFNFRKNSTEKGAKDFITKLMTVSDVKFKSTTLTQNEIESLAKTGTSEDNITSLIDNLINVAKSSTKNFKESDVLYTVKFNFTKEYIKSISDKAVFKEFDNLINNLIKVSNSSTQSTTPDQLAGYFGYYQENDGIRFCFETEQAAKDFIQLTAKNNLFDKYISNNVEKKEFSKDNLKLIADRQLNKFNLYNIVAGVNKEDNKTKLIVKQVDIIYDALKNIKLDELSNILHENTTSFENSMRNFLLNKLNQLSEGFAHIENAAAKYHGDKTIGELPMGADLNGILLDIRNFVKAQFNKVVDDVNEIIEKDGNNYTKASFKPYDGAGEKSICLYFSYPVAMEKRISELTFQRPLLKKWINMGLLKISNVSEETIDTLTK